MIDEQRSSRETDPGRGNWIGSTDVRDQGRWKRDEGYGSNPASIQDGERDGRSQAKLVISRSRRGRWDRMVGVGVGLYPAE